MSSIDDEPRVVVESADDLDAWLRANHARATGCWVVTWKRHTGRPRPTTEEIVRTALRHGWIDSVPRRLDEDRTMLRVSPRRPGSGWSGVNKQHVAELEAAGLMTPSGQAVVDAARTDGSWTLLDDVTALRLPDDLAIALDAHGVRDVWDALSPSVRRGALEQLLTAKRAPTRARRIGTIVDACREGRRPFAWVRDGESARG